MDEEIDRAWQGLSEAVLAEVKQWRTTHPKATFQELERAIHERMSRLEAQVLQDAALASRTPIARVVERPSSHEGSISGISKDQADKRSRSREAMERVRRVELLEDN